MNCSVIFCKAYKQIFWKASCKFPIFIDLHQGCSEIKGQVSYRSFYNGNLREHFYMFKKKNIWKFYCTTTNNSHEETFHAIWIRSTSHWGYNFKLISIDIPITVFFGEEETRFSCTSIDGDPVILQLFYPHFKYITWVLQKSNAHLPMSAFFSICLSIISSACICF